MKKRCGRCGIPKDTGAFNKRTRRGKIGLQSICRTCQSETHAAYYQENKDRFHEYHQQRRSRLQQGLRDLKLSGCIYCGETHPSCLDFHHTDPGRKEHNVGMMIRDGYSLDRIKLEAEKCELICSNCHRKLHWS